MKPVDQSIFEYHSATFPMELRQTTASVPVAMLRAMEEASLALTKFDAFRAATMADRRLSPTGKREALKEWAETNLPALRTTLEKAAQKASETEASVIASIMRDVIDKPTEVADVALAQEVRSYFRTMPDDLARSDALRRLAASDKSVLRSVLAAPAFLSGVSEDQLDQIRNDAARAAEPDRWAKVESMRQGWAATEKAVAAAVRAVQEALAEPAQATGDRNLPEPDPENTARVMDALRKSPNAEQLGLS